MSTITDDKRTPADIEKTIGYVVATDSFLSGWGQAPGRSLFAVPIFKADEIDVVMDNMHARSDMKRARWCSRLPRLRDGDHLSIRARDDVDRFFTWGGFRQGGG